jgi:hypothetical protein
MRRLAGSSSAAACGVVSVGLAAAVRVRGDSGEYQVDVVAGRDSFCPCPARTWRCSHVRAAELVVDVGGDGEGVGGP